MKRITPHVVRKFPLRITLALAAVVLLAFAGKPVSAQSPDSIPNISNIEGGLNELIRLNHEALAKGQPGVRLSAVEPVTRATGGKKATGLFRLQYDQQNRVLVTASLDRTVSLATVKNMVGELGGAFVASDDSNGLVSAYLPIAATETLAHASGVSSIHLEHRAITHVGLTTSQGAVVMRSDLANQRGFNGDGITVGILSDSFNTSGSPDTALTDVHTGDLPNTTAIPGGEGLKFLIELDPAAFGPGTDEGRGMAQIVHDIAPNASLCFATAFSGEVDFANNIRALRTNPACNADVITDDVAYFDEPFFSDGILAQAVDDVATSETLPGHKVAYFSSAGNEAKQGYASDLRIISDTAARSITPATLGVDLSTIPATIDTTGGFHNFDATGGLNIAQDFAFADGTPISFQWDDPFNLTPSGITTDLNVLFFDPVTGKFLFAFDDDNFMTNQPIELFQLNTGGGPGTFAEVLMVVARTGKGTHLAKRIKYVDFGTVIDFNGVITAQTPVTFGHPCARGANGVAAYVYTTDPAFPTFLSAYENFSSPGPSTIVFDKNGNRLAHPEIRKKPDIAAVDGVNTTFFPEGPGNDYEAIVGAPDGFPNFFGTSAAAPHAAGVAALVIQKAGGPGSISPGHVSTILKASAPRRDSDLFFSEAVATNNDANVTVTATGEDLRAVGLSDNFFNVTFRSRRPGQTLDTLTIDLTGTGLLFDPVAHPVHVGTTTGPVIVSSAPGTQSATVTLNFSGFTSGQSLTFGVDRDFADVHGKAVEFGGNSGDEMAGARLTATLSAKGDRDKDTDTLTGVFRNDLDFGYQIYDGFGLIDAINALKLTRPPDEDDESSAGFPAN
jgi:hypothetical protein